MRYAKICAPIFKLFVIANSYISCLENITIRKGGVHASDCIHTSRTRAREFRWRACECRAASYVAGIEDGIAQTSRHDTVLAQSLISLLRMRVCGDRLLLAGNVAHPCDYLDFAVTSIWMLVLYENQWISVSWIIHFPREYPSKHRFQ